MTARSRATAFIAGGALILGSTLVAPSAAHAGRTDIERFVAQVSTRNVMQHLRQLEKIATENDGNRAALTTGYEESARYIERTLKRAGYTTERDYFTFDRRIVDAASATLDGPAPATYEVHQMALSTSSPDGGLTGAVVSPTDSLGCTADTWDGVPATGAIAVISRGGCTFATKAANAELAGAAGVVVYNNTDGMLIGTLGEEGLVSIPVAGMAQADGEALVAAAAGADVSLTLDLRFHVEEVESFNVLAETRRGRDDNVVMLGAHLDSVEDGPGINDNGTGSAAILEVAVQLAKVKKHDNTVRFAWWGAEELGLIGSTEYVDELATQEGELERIATYLNFDMVGSPNYVIGVYDADESTYVAPVEVPAGSAETEDVLTGYFDGIGQPWVDTEFSGRSDYQAFILHGVPASGLFTGADDIKTAEEVALFGGTAGVRHDPQYHTPEDRLANIDQTALGIMSKAVAAATFSLAQDTSAINGVSGPGEVPAPHPSTGPRPGPLGDQAGRLFSDAA